MSRINSIKSRSMRDLRHSEASNFWDSVDRSALPRTGNPSFTGTRPVTVPINSLACLASGNLEPCQ